MFVLVRVAYNGWMDEQLPERVIKGRGAVGNPSGRFEPYSRSATHDGWWLDPEELEQRPETRVLPDASRTILARNCASSLIR